MGGADGAALWTMGGIGRFIVGACGLAWDATGRGRAIDSGGGAPGGGPARAARIVAALSGRGGGSGRCAHPPTTAHATTRPPEAQAKTLLLRPASFLRDKTVGASLSTSRADDCIGTAASAGRRTEAAAGRPAHAYAAKSAPSDEGRSTSSVRRRWPSDIVGSHRKKSSVSCSGDSTKGASLVAAAA